MTRHWRTEVDPDGIRWLLIDQADTRVNALSQAVLSELAELVDQAAEKPPPGIVLKSGKESGFIAGADISEFRALADSGEAGKLVRLGQGILDRLEQLPCPTVAAIRGFALGGGLELALACDYRVAVADHGRNIGFPEVRLGIHPGLGGTVRSIRLCGPLPALKLMLSGRAISPFDARRIGLLDRVVPETRLDQAARELVLSRPRKRRAPVLQSLAGLRVARPLLRRRLEARVRRRARPEHYPAPFAILDLWARHGARGLAAFEAEAQSIGRLLGTRTSRNLVRLYFLRERLRNLASRSTDIRHVHVAGAGVMGGDIAAWCALRGFRVTIHDRSPAQLETAMKRAETLFRGKLKASGEAAEARQRLVADASGVAEADLVIEAIVERLDAKRALFEELEQRMRPDALLATNTSSIDLDELSESIVHRRRFLGLHFFNPVARLPLVEVVRCASTDDAQVSRATAFVHQIGKLPLPCRSAPGFLVNRVLAPYFAEALYAFCDGYAPETIDQAAKDFGMPMGPVELADRVGLDVVLHSAKSLATGGGEAIRLLRSKVEAGELGAKSGTGFYRFRNHRRLRSRRYAPPDRDLQDRLTLPLINAALGCHADGIVEDLDLVDAGVVFGTGFAPFRGGPIEYARVRGIEVVVRRMETLAATFGARLAPHPDWEKLTSV